MDRNKSGLNGTGMVMPGSRKSFAQQAEIDLREARAGLANMLDNATLGGRERFNTVDVHDTKKAIGKINNALVYFDHLKKVRAGMKEILG